MKGVPNRTLAVGKAKPTTKCFKCNSKNLEEAIPMVTVYCLDCDAEMSINLPKFHTYKNIDFKACHKTGNMKPL